MMLTGMMAITNVGKMMMGMMGENKEKRKRKDASDSWHLLSH